MARSKGESMKLNKKIVKNNLKLSYRAFKKQWDVFYRSKFGKLGFYIMIAFIIVTLISPMIVHGNPFLAVPSEDYFTPISLMNKSLGFTPDNAVNITATVGEHSTDYYAFMAGSLNGTNYVFAISSNNGTSERLFKTNGSAVSLKAFTPENPTTESFETWIMAATDHTIYVTEVECIPFLNGSGAAITTSHFVDKTINANIEKAYVSTGTFATGKPSTDHDECVINAVNSSNAPSFVYAFVSNSTGNYLNSYLTGNLNEYWHENLTFKPDNLYFVGNQFSSLQSSYARIIVTGAHNIEMLSQNGAVIKYISTESTVSTLYIPSDYQARFLSSGHNTSYEVIGDSVYSLNLKNGVSREIYTANATITAFSSADGSTGIPTYFIVITSKDYLNSMSYNIIEKKLVINNIIKIPDTVNRIVPYCISGAPNGEYTLSDTAHGYVTFLISASFRSVNATSWHFNSKEIITAPLIFQNEYNLSGTPTEIVFISGTTLHIYSNEGNATVLGPSFYTSSGVILPFGVNSAYNNVWKIYLESFAPDLEVGFVAGLITIIISVIMAMFIGYYRGLFSGFVETVSLAIFLIPTLPLFIVLATVLGPTLFNLIFIFSLLGWPFVTFSLIGIVRSVKSRTFVDSAIVSNLSTSQIMRRHILPNMGSLLGYLLAVNIGGAVAAVSTYEILGLAPLTIPTWGGMLSGFLDNYFILGSEPWVVLPALLTVAMFILAFIFIARGIDEVANPTLGDR